MGQYREVSLHAHGCPRQVSVLGERKEVTGPSSGEPESLLIRTKEKEILVYKPRGFELSALKGLVKFIGCGKQAGAGHQPDKKQSTVATRQGTLREI